MTKDMIKKIIKQNDGIRINGIEINPLLPKASIIGDSLRAGTKYYIRISYERKDISKLDIHDLVSRLLFTIGLDNVIAYKWPSSEIMRRVGGIYVWDGHLEKTSRDRCDITILTTENRNDEDRPLIDVRCWAVLKPELIHAIGGN